MTPQELKQGKAQVLDHLIRPLDELMRYKRPRKVKTHMAHVAALAEMQTRLAYLDAGELMVLRETVIDAAPAGGEWPPVAVVLTWARSLRHPPEDDTGRVANLVRWAASKSDFPNGALPALYQWLKRNPGVPNDFVLGDLRRQADEDDRTFVRWQQAEDRGAALSSFEEGKMRQMRRDRARVAAILDADAREVA